MKTNHFSDKSEKWNYKAWTCKTNTRKTLFYLLVVTDTTVKIAVLEIRFEKKSKESIAGTFKNICTVAVHGWCIKDALQDFVNKFLKKKMRRHFSGWLFSLEFKVYLEKFIFSPGT